MNDYIEDLIRSGMTPRLNQSEIDLTQTWLARALRVANLYNSRDEV